MDVLTKLFGSTARVKIIRLFLLNPDTSFITAEIKAKSKVSSDTLKKELSLLKTIELVKTKSFFVDGKKFKNGKVLKKMVQGYELNLEFPYLNELRGLIINTESFNKEAIAERFKKVGKIKMVVIAGIFIDSDQGRLDLLVVGDSFKPGLFDKALKILESEVGCELRYATFQTNDFIYRLGLYDKFIRDILDYPHRKLVNKLDV